MAHRGRLDDAVSTPWARCPGTCSPSSNAPRPKTLLPGDVEVPARLLSEHRTPGGPVHLSLAFNPVAPGDRVEPGGREARSKGRMDAAAATRPGNQVLPVAGAAAMPPSPARASVMETLALAQTRRRTPPAARCIVVINNQIGFTTSDPLVTMRSHAVLHRMVVEDDRRPPVLRVNGDDPEAVVLQPPVEYGLPQQFRRTWWSTSSASANWATMNGTRRQLTQPLMYKKIGRLPGTHLRRQAGGAGACCRRDGRPDGQDLRAAFDADAAAHVRDPVLTNFKTSTRSTGRPLGKEVDRRGRHCAADGGSGWPSG